MKKGNIVGEPFAKYVNEQIKQRQSFHGSGFNNTRDPKHIQYLNARTSWVKMASSVLINEENEKEEIVGGEIRLSDIGLNPKDFIGQQLAEKSVLFNGLQEATFNPSEEKTNIPKKFSGFNQRKGIANSNSIWNSAAYGLGGTDFGLQPMPGITNVEISHLNRGSIRKATVSLKAYNKVQFSIIETLYLRLGFTMLVEWGDSHYIENETTKDDDGNIIQNKGDVLQVNNTLIEDYWFSDTYPNKETHLDVLNRIEKYRKRYDGNYDGFFGRVSNFNWNFNQDASYDITIDLISLGDVIESLKVNTLSTPEKTGNDVETATANTGKTSQTTRNKRGRKISSSKTNNNTILNFLNKKRENPTFNSNDKDYFSANNVIEDNQSWWSKPFGLDNGETKYYDYIRFGAFLNFLKDNVIPKLENGGKKFPFIDIETDTDSNIMALYPNQFSINSRVCIINSNYFSIDSRLDNLPPFFENLDKFYDPQKKVPYGKIMNIYLNFDLIERVTKAKTDNKGNLSFFEFLQAICNEINKSLGSVNNLEPIVNENLNKITIIDQNSLPQNQRDKLRKDLLAEGKDKKTEEQQSTTLELYSYNKENSTSNFVKSFSFKTEIGPDLSTIISIGATSQGNVVGSDATAFSKWNEGLKDKFQQGIGEADEIPEKEAIPSAKTSTTRVNEKPISSGRRDPSSANSKKQKSINNFGASASEFRKYLIKTWGGEIYDNANWGETPQYFISDSDFIDQGLKLFTSEYFKTIVNNQKTTSSIGFIPVKLSLELDGISGIKIYQSLKIRTDFLPNTYPKTLEFLITKVTHSLQSNKWVTRIETISQPVIEDIIVGNEEQVELQQQQPYITENGIPLKRIPVNELTLSANGLNFIKQKEDFRKNAYDDAVETTEDKPLPLNYKPIGKITIGYGQTRITETITRNTSRGKRNQTITRDVKPGDTITQPNALSNLKSTINSDIKVIKQWLAVPMTQNEFDALVSFAYNSGPGNSNKPTFVNHLNGKNYVEAGNSLLLYNKSNGVTVKGLISRRQEELDIWLKNNPGNPK